MSETAGGGADIDAADEHRRRREMAAIVKPDAVKAILRPSDPCLQYISSISEFTAR
jgi:hypothetical protein